MKLLKGVFLARVPILWRHLDLKTLQGIAIAALVIFHSVWLYEYRDVMWST
jgi:hypothetical protein